MQKEIAIIDYGMGNLHSIRKKLTRLKINSIISSDPKEIQASGKIILPGVGHFKEAMERLRALSLTDVLNEEVLLKRKPVLGICLGMQLMANKSEEGNCDGLGWIDARVVKFKIQDTLKYKVPHTGWNQVTIAKQSLLMKNIPDYSEFYFVHSFHFEVNNTNDILNETDFEYKFVSAVEHDNVYGVQYHPEKSHDIGDVLLTNFINL